ncbi:bifunctional molybdenum cofactor biosynthesis protein MoaC/MoaB [Parapedobacter sp. ISTM3]|uniref:Molybdenum cofactor biosynthesis protein MoaC n=1 Tax=Parapedobacter luteus TaxID=623280 RepID=A0A1T5B1I1_9SPHI|nr:MULTISPECIES: bifunctional molybdenum cofactor biosynthesis protein MoaC/MoaB [Parapedobacter]MBK1440427.1 bifunctional molybdenum cofactor biosynthesis protein MoaC/MoaB [Parapedobacter sp. ISTM3]SKB40949.1 molybdenum cofactor biosynthesis protein MoaC [Parapedobacter luteus]
MVNITHKTTTLRQAIALATVKVSNAETIRAVQERSVPKGDVLEFSRAAGLLAIKKTSDVVPDCHPLPIEYAAITYRMEDQLIEIRVEVHTIYKTGVEVEAMHGAMITALTLYDMLKPIDKELEIKSVRLESKRGGKSDHKVAVLPGFKCAVVICSDRISAGLETDVSGKVLVDMLQQWEIAPSEFTVVPDEVSQIQETAMRLHAQGYDLVLFSGGTGLSVRDVTPEAIKPLLDQEIPGVMEAARRYGQERTALAMLSRGIAGFMGDTLIITLPGSPKGVRETMDAIFPAILHVFKIRKGGGH